MLPRHERARRVSRSRISESVASPAGWRQARIVNVSSHQQSRNVKWRRSSISSFFPTRVPNRDTSFVRSFPRGAVALSPPWHAARAAGQQCVNLIHAEEESNVVVHETVHRDPTMNTTSVHLSFLATIRREVDRFLGNVSS